MYFERLPDSVQNYIPRALASVNVVDQILCKILQGEKNEICIKHINWISRLTENNSNLKTKETATWEWKMYSENRIINNLKNNFALKIYAYVTATTGKLHPGSRKRLGKWIKDSRINPRNVQWGWSCPRPIVPSCF